MENPLKYKDYPKSRTRFYRTWASMKRRCKTRSEYIEKGVKVCDRWDKFRNFFEDMYESYLRHIKKYGEANTTIDRIDNFGHYKPSNCRWATHSVQTLNTSRATSVFEEKKWYKTCMGCQTKKPLDKEHFHQAKPFFRGFYPLCKECNNKRMLMRRIKI